MAISPETAATTRSIFSMLSRTPRRSTSTPWTLRGRRKRQPSSTRTTERRAKQEERRSPLTDSNRRPPLYEEGPCVKWRRFVHRPVRADAGVVGGELGSSLYRLLEGEDKADWSSLRWRISLGTVRRPGGRWRLWERRAGCG